MLTITGMEWKQFYNDPDFWKSPYYMFHDDDVIYIDGRDYLEIEKELQEKGDYNILTKVADDSLVVVESGFIYLEHKDEPPMCICTIEEFYNQWKYQ